MAEIKAAGKGDITHYPEIESEDLTKLYNNIYMDPSTPSGLANRVQMNKGNNKITEFDAALFAFTVFVGTKFCLLAMISSSE
jgi:hypothetical protein